MNSARYLFTAAGLALVAGAYSPLTAIPPDCQMHGVCSNAAAATEAPPPPPPPAPARPTFGADGTVHVPAFDLPASELSSPEARAAQAARAKMAGGAPPSDIPVEIMRRGDRV